MFDKPTQPSGGTPPAAGSNPALPTDGADVALAAHPILDKPTALESGRLQQPSAPPSPPALQPPIAQALVGGAPAQLSGPVLHPTKSNKIKWVILAVVFVALFGALGVWVYILNRPSQEVKEVVTPQKVEEPAPVEPVDVDSDKDALMDSREKELGTDKNNPDSDFDGLTDNEEVTLWNTDPLIDDTDKDGYKDGDEVGNGYNPAGPGRLFNINDTNL